jgi:hypothetical protein
MYLIRSFRTLVKMMALHNSGSFHGCVSKVCSMQDIVVFHILFTLALMFLMLQLGNSDQQTMEMFLTI